LKFTEHVCKYHAQSSAKLFIADTALLLHA